ncbi:MAG TPA: chemotaxis protein CheB [Candidatus Eremiobacteraceae bacterium]|nr:chemotaxis protein CheB [Candidatus Eremiobacteraceae bacterium]
MASSDGDEPVPDQRQGFLVVTGSSAGGVDALMNLVAHLPADLPVPVVVAQHLSPQHESRLAEILSGHTALTVDTIVDEAVVQPGRIYVVPPNHDVEVVDSLATTKLQVTKGGPKPSIDRLFASAADAYGDRLIAIILSGLGSDGARGARAVKNAGGTVIVQDPQSAGFSAMPLSIPPTLVDITAPPEAMGKIIVDLLGSTRLATDADDKNLLRTLLAILRERSGIDFSQYKTPTIMRRLSRLMVSSGVSSIADYLPYLQRNPDGYQRLVNSFLIKVTEFFRDAALFEILRNDIMPKLIAEAQAAQRELRIWSAGTSTGEEAYSLAILCEELMRDHGSAVNARIFATDVDEQAIAFARGGVYSADSLRHLPESLVARHFTKIDDRYEVTKQIRNMTVFGQHDLGQRAPFPRIDLVLCRNVLIYFTKDLQSRALQLFAFALRDRGFLVLGKAESTTPLPQFFKLFNSTLKIYERDGERVMLPPTHLKAGSQAQPIPSFLGQPARDHLRLAHEQSRIPNPDALAGYVNTALVGVVVVDRNYDIQSINSAARAMLQIHGVGVGSDLIHLLPASGAHLRGMVDAAFAGERLEPAVVIAKDTVSGVDRWLRVHCSNQKLTTGGMGDNVGIVMVDVGRYEERVAELEIECERLKAEMGDQTKRSAELSGHVKSMLAANDELTHLNAELRMHNEQLLVNAEEAASSNEEIETLNEEMQATNEELETLNEELQATVEELNTTNDELEARTAELEDANASAVVEVEKTESRAASLEAALTRLGLLCAVVSPRGEVLYIAPEVAELSSNGGLANRWWRENGTLRLRGGREYRVAVSRLDDGTNLVTFESSH